MALVYATRTATDNELELFRSMLSTFRDGSGNEREADGTTRAGWRQIERCVAELLQATGGEDKGIFDVVGRDPTNPRQAYGYSVKSKQLEKRSFDALETNGRVYMEIANSPAKFWAELTAAHGVTEQDFRDMKYAQEIGNTLIEVVEKWHRLGKAAYEALYPGVTVDIANSCYFCLSYSRAENPDDRRYQIHIFPLEYPRNIVWRYKSSSCLSGYDPLDPTCVLVDWYGVSGGQLKYYPRASTARFKSPPFSLFKPPAAGTLRDRAVRMFKDF